MNARQRFERYMGHLAEGLGHLDRHAGLNDYCTGLMLPLSRMRSRVGLATTIAEAATQQTNNKARSE